MVGRLRGIPEFERIKLLTKKAEESALISEMPGLSIEQLLIDIRKEMALSNELFIHNHTIDEDEDASDSVKFSLSSGEGASVELYVPSGYVLLLTRFVLSDFDDNSYVLYFDDNPYIYGPELSSPSGFLAIDEHTKIQFVLANDGIYTNEYLAELRAIYRRKSDWKWSVVKSKSQVGSGGF